MSLLSFRKHLNRVRINVFAQESLYLHDILSDIKCTGNVAQFGKHKHMLKNGAPPDNFRVLYHFNRWNSGLEQKNQTLTLMLLHGIICFSRWCRSIKGCIVL